MAKKDIFLKGSPANFKRLLVLVCLTLIFSREVLASPFNLDFSVQGNNLYVDDWIFSGRQLYLSYCTPDNGRVFSFTSPAAFRLSGILVFFRKDASATPADVLNPDGLKISVFEGSVFDPEKALVFRVPFKGSHPSHNSLAESFSLGLSQARGIFFELEPLWLEKDATYKVALECPAGTLPHNIYGDGKNPEVKSLDSSTLAVSGLSNIRKPYFQLYSKNDGSAKVKPAVKTPPANRPVIFVHALGGFPADFSEYTDLLKSAGWPGSYLLNFDYGLKDGKYNNYGDLNDLIGRLNTAVATLSAGFKADGGDGKINLIGYSSGALLARNYLVSNKSTPRVQRFISIAGAFKGSFLADLEGGNDNFLRGIGDASARLAKIFLPNLSSSNPFTLGRTPPDKIFKTQIVSDSAKVTGFKREDLPSSISYYSLQGDIKGESNQKLFKSLITSSGSLGDGAVLGTSSSDLPNLSSFSFLDTAIATRSVTKSTATVSASFLLPDFSKIKFFHGSLLKAQEIKNKILDLLK